MVIDAMKGLYFAALLLAGALGANQGFANTLPAAPTDDTATDDAAQAPIASRDMDALAQRRALQETITNLESEYGAYSPVLPERLLSLGLALQSEGRHTEAAAVFKRGTHLARVSTGLYSLDQLPLLESEIASLQALGDYRAVDDRQRYLYRVQSKAPLSSAQRVRAYVQQADWQRQAFLLNMDEEPGLRLLQMWEYYRLALTEVLDQSGDTSRDLLPPLYGMLQAQYLIAGYRWPDSGDNTGNGFTSNNLRPLGNSYLRDNFDKGRAVLQAIYDLEQLHGSADPQAGARAQTLLGDWLLWHGDSEGAMAEYAKVLAELADDAAAQALYNELFAEPVPLPALDGLDVHGPLAVEGDGDILLGFNVAADGKVSDLQRLDDSGAANGLANRLMRNLRNTPFRPRFDLASGTPVATDNLVMAYDSTR
jgi:hypothetical protein